MNYLSGLPEAELAKQHRALASLTNCAEALFGWKALAATEAEMAIREVRAQNGGARYASDQCSIDSDQS